MNQELHCASGVRLGLPATLSCHVERVFRTNVTRQGSAEKVKAEAYRLIIEVIGGGGGFFAYNSEKRSRWRCLLNCSRNGCQLSRSSRWRLSDPCLADQEQECISGRRW